jgi:5'-nucleotidase/UDP-sugar diphosphatase
MRRFVLVLSALALACSGGNSRKLFLFHSNDEHSHLLGFVPEADDFPAPTAAGTGAIKGGVARRAVVLKAQRDQAAAAGADSLTVSAGDNMMGTLFQIAATTASADYQLMGPKHLAYDVTTLGNHEFDYGPNNLATSIKVAAAGDGLPTIVATNIHFSGSAGDADLSALFDETGTDTTKPIHRKWVVTTKSGLKVGFIGIMGADAAAVAPLKAPTRFSLPAGSTDDTNRVAALSQIFDEVQPYVNSLRRDDKADVVVALSHSGADLNFPNSSEDFAIAKNVSGVDVVVSGHSHTEVPATLITNARTGKQVLVQQAGRFGDNLGVVSLTVAGDGTVSFDTTASHLIKVDDTTIPDQAISTFIAGVMTALETQPIGPGKPSFLKLTLGEILQGDPKALKKPGDYYNYPLATLGFDVDNSAKYQETELLDLAADAQLAAANALGLPTQISIEASGVLRTTSLAKGKSGQLGFGDVFIAVPLGASPVSGTPGYPLCRFAVFLAEVKAAMEVTAGYAYAGHDDSFFVPAGFKFEYDTTRPLFNPGGDPTDKANGRVTKIWQLKASALAAGNYDGDSNYTQVFDANTTGWLSVSPLQPLSPACISRTRPPARQCRATTRRRPSSTAPTPPR